MGYLLLNTYKLCASDIVDAATDLVSSQILQIAHIIIKIIHDSISANLSSHCREMKDKFDFLAPPDLQAIYQSVNLYLMSMWLDFGSPVGEGAISTTPVTTHH